jgi:transcription elongation factor Elf1
MSQIYECSQCGMQFRYKVKLVQHLDVHAKKGQRLDQSKTIDLTREAEVHVYDRFRGKPCPLCNQTEMHKDLQRGRVTCKTCGCVIQDQMFRGGAGPSYFAPRSWST